jgi:hypothetical protein
MISSWILKRSTNEKEQHCYCTQVSLKSPPCWISMRSGEDEERKGKTHLCGAFHLRLNLGYLPWYRGAGSSIALVESTNTSQYNMRRRKTRMTQPTTWQDQNPSITMERYYCTSLANRSIKITYSAPLTFHITWHEIVIHFAWCWTWK